MSSTPSSKSRRRTSLQIQSTKSSYGLHRRSTTGTPIPMPSHRPPSTFHSFRGDIKTQDIFIEELKKLDEKLHILFPGEDTFEMERMEMWNHDAICTPCLILQPKSIKQVSACLQGYTTGYLKCLSANRKLGVTIPVPRLCVAGGRNSCNAMRDGSIVLDLSEMRKVSVDVKTQTCDVQGGARVIDLDSALVNYGLIAVSGTNQNLGVVGCLMGGGLGYASRKYGLACDNLLSAEIVISDGRLKHCSPTKHQDLFWSICGGGGGIGVIVSVTLRCFPLRHAASLSYELQASSSDHFYTVLRRWANWVEGDKGVDEVESDNTLDVNEGATRDVYSHLLLQTNCANISFLGTSINTDVISQTEGLLDGLSNDKFKKKKRRPFSFLHSNSDKRCPTQWNDIPGLSDLIDNKFGSPNRVQENFKILRYDQLQAYTDEYQKPGHVIHATKFADSLTKRIIEIMVRATLGEMSRKNESRITITSAGGAVNDVNGDCAAFDARCMKYSIFIEGRWDADTVIREQKEKKKTRSWMNWVVKQLHLCEGISSTAYPESSLGRDNQSDVNVQPLGAHNFSEESGTRLMEIRKKRDPKRIFSHASRVSWSPSKEGIDYATDQAASVGTDSDLSCIQILKDVDLNPSKCPVQLNQSTLSCDTCPSAGDSIPSDTSSSNGDCESLNKSESKQESNEVSIEGGNELVLEDNEEDTVSSDLKMLIQLASDSSDDLLKDWSLEPETDTHFNDEEVFIC